MREFIYSFVLLSIVSARRARTLLSSSLSRCRRTPLKLTLSESERERNVLLHVRPAQRAVFLSFSVKLRTSKSYKSALRGSRN